MVYKPADRSRPDSHYPNLIFVDKGHPYVFPEVGSRPADHEQPSLADLLKAAKAVARENGPALFGALEGKANER